MDQATLITFFFASLVLMIKPGPVMMTFISLSLEGKWRSIIAFWLGYEFISIILHHVLLSLISTLPQGYGLIFIFFKGGAAILFITLGLNALNQSIQAMKEGSKELLENSISKESLFKTFCAGGLLCASNPYEILWIVTAVPTLLGQTSFTFMEINIVFGIIILANLIVQAAYILPIFYVRNFLSTDLISKLKLISAILLIGIGLYIFSTVLLQWDLIEAGTLSQKME